MKRYFLLFILVVIAVFSVLPDTVETVPKPKPRYARPFLPAHWFSIETEGCPCGYMCYYNMWIPKFEVGPPGLWVFGVTPWEQQGGTLHFRQYPDRDCTQHCFDCPPILYTADVIYIRYYGGEYPDIAPEDVHLTYIPPGKYVLTSQNFTLYHNAKIWWFADDGTGPKGMSAHLETDKPVYEGGEMVHLFLQVTDQDTGEPIQVDSITGDIVLPDETRKTIITDMWAWNSAEEQYEYTYNLKNDAGTYSNPQEGMYSASVTVEKAFYQNAGASCEFEVKEEKEGEFDCQFSEVEKLYLAEKYAPYLCFYADADEEEKYYPTLVNLALKNSTFWEFGSSESVELLEYDNTAEFIASYRDPGFYLDLNDEGCRIDSDIVDAQAGDRNVYYRVVCEYYDGDTYIVIQYWFFYIFNDHINNHEGEWEMVEVLLDYHTKDPIGAAYARHEWGEYRHWHEIEKEGTHPVAYIAEGSHAAYFFEELFTYGNNFDKTSDDGWKGPPEMLSPMLNEPWLQFGGNWGYRIRHPDDWKDCPLWNSGPRGPTYKGEKWSSPVEWAFSYYHNSPEILRSPYMLFSLSCPADMLITNSAGRRLGYVDGEFVQEIPNSYVQDCDEEESYLVPGADEYAVEILGTGDGIFDFICVVSSWDSTKTLKYSSVPVNAMTKAILDLKNLFLEVDMNQDGIADFTVSPELVQLSSPQPITPLEGGAEMVYEVVLTNQADLQTFALEVDTPIGWSYSLSSETVTLDRDESATLLLTVTSPSDIPVQDYTIRVEATSLDNGISASLTLIASSKAELVLQDLEVTHDGENVTMTATVSNFGLIDVKSAIIQFFDDSSSRSVLLGEKIIEINSGETVVTSFNCTLPDGLYVYHVVIDPDDLISESCEFNNELSMEYLLDRTPPEAEIFFDPTIEDLVVRGVDNLDLSVDISVTEKVIKNRIVRTYILKDDAGNTTELELEIKRHKHEIKAEILDMKYNDDTVTIPENSLKIEYLIEDGKAKMLNQFLVIGNTKVHLIYKRNEDQTKIIVNDGEKMEEGIFLVVVRTEKGKLEYTYENVR
jgi:hypothetical protein